MSRRNLNRREKANGRRKARSQTHTLKGSRVRTNGRISGDSNLHPGTCVVCGEEVRARSGRLIKRKNGEYEVEHLRCSQVRLGRGLWGQARRSPKESTDGLRKGVARRGGAPLSSAGKNASAHTL